MGITKVIVRHEDFDVSREMEELRKGSGSAGAMVAFTGVVRNRNQGDDIFALTRIRPTPAGSLMTSS